MFSTERGQQPEPFQVKFTPYQYDSGSHPEYKALVAERKAQEIECFRVISLSKSNDMGPARVVTLETKFIFGNQWNTPDGYRLFNWYEAYTQSKWKHGHYLEITDRMREVCKTTHVCGYCGAAYWGMQHEGKFCSACLDSSYLEEDKLHLLRLMSVPINGSVRTERPELTEAEKGIILPVYVERQTVAKDSRAVQQAEVYRKKIKKDYAETLQVAKIEHDGFLWLLDHHVAIDNVIYYKHKNVFSFGWRNPLAQDVKSKLLDLLSEFPYEYELK